MTRKLDKKLYDFIIIGLVAVTPDGDENGINSIGELGDDDRLTYSLFGRLIEGGRDELQMDFDSEQDAIDIAEMLSENWNMEYTLEY